jgi:cobalt-zinc-cadmium efflux system outer membrane protein
MSFGRLSLRLVFFGGGILLAGCATRPAVDSATLPVLQTAESFSARSLHDQGLRQFLLENLGAVPDAWDFETLSWVAFYFHPSLELARAQWSTARAVAHTAGVRPNPTITVAPGFNSTRTPGLSPWILDLNFDVLFPTAGKAGHQQAIARSEAEAARLAVFSAAWQVRSELRHALTEAVMASRRETILRAQVESQRKLVVLLEQRFAAGSSTATEVSAMRSGWLRAEVALGDASSEREVARTRVAAALGLPSTALDHLTLPSIADGPVLSPEALARARGAALRNRADILAALAKYSAAQSALALEFARRIPDFHLGPGYQWDQGSNKWTLGISLELPVFHRNEAPIAEATARRAEAAAQFNLVQAQAIAAIEAAAAAQRSATAHLERARQLRAESEKQSSRIQQRLELGGADQVEAVAAETELAAIGVALVDAESAVAVASGQLEDALQLPFPHLATLANAAPATAHAP